MNDMILANAKQANEAGNANNHASNTVLGKRPRSDVEDNNAEAEPQKRRKK